MALIAALCCAFLTASGARADDGYDGIDANDLRLGYPSQSIWSLHYEPVNLRKVLRQDRILREELGTWRMREFNEARFHVYRYTIDPNRELVDDPYTAERARDLVFSNFRKLLRENLEVAFELEERGDRLWDRMRGKDPFAEERERFSRPSYVRDGRLDLSPQINVGSSNDLGVKLRYKGTDQRFFNASSFLIRHNFDGEGLLMRYRYLHGDNRFELEHRTNDRELGGVYMLSYRTSF